MNYEKLQKSAQTNGDITSGTIQSLKVDLRGRDVKSESVYAGSGILRAGGDLSIKNLNGDFDVAATGKVLIDGCDGKVEIESAEVDIHLDSSVKNAKINAKSVTVRTPPQVKVFYGFRKNEQS